MIGERTERGIEACLRPGGFGRFFGAAFLLVWICGWAVGECFALWVLFRCATALITGEPIEAGQRPLALAAALAIGGFLLVWLALWTLGGVAAITELLRMLWAEDRLIAGGGELQVEHRLGPFRSRRVIPRADLRDVRLHRRGALIAETPRSAG